MAELADAQDLKSCGVKSVPVRFRSPALKNAKSKEVLRDQRFFCHIGKEKGKINLNILFSEEVYNEADKYK